jgi:hypothetical protein
MITEGQILRMVDELEQRVQARDSTMSVRLQVSQNGLGTTYLVHIENAISRDTYLVDADTHQWIRVLE